MGNVISMLASKLNPANSQLKNPPKEWPPSRADKVRTQGYADSRELYKGNHELVLDPKNLARDYDLYVAVNLPSLVVKIPADLLHGEPMTRDYEDGVAEDAQQRVEDIWDRNAFQTLAYELTIDTGVAGDGLIVVNRNEASEAELKTVNPEHWFPVFDPDDQREVLLHRLAWLKEGRDDRNNELELLRMIEHDRGEIRHRLFLLEQGEIKREASDSEWAWIGQTRPPNVETGVDDFLLVHVPNYRSGGEYFGRGDYVGVESLYAALDARVTQRDHILSKHSDPTWNMPPQLFEYFDSKYNGIENVPPRALNFLKHDSNTDGKAERITWDGKLTDNRDAITDLTDQILMLSEVDRSLVGRGDGLGAISGRALRVLLIRTLAKVGRKWMYQKPALEHALELAQQLEGVEPVEVRLLKSDGLPQDTLESVQTSAELLLAGLTSKVREIMKQHDVSRAEAEDILAEIAEEDDTDRNSEAVASATARRTPINVNLNAEDLGA